MEPLFISVPEAAQALGVGLTKINELISSGELRAAKIGTRRLVSVDDLKAFATSLLTPAEVV